MSPSFFRYRQRCGSWDVGRTAFGNTERQLWRFYLFRLSDHRRQRVCPRRPVRRAVLVIPLRQIRHKPFLKVTQGGRIPFPVRIVALRRQRQRHPKRQRVRLRLIVRRVEVVIRGRHFPVALRILTAVPTATKVHHRAVRRLPGGGLSTTRRLGLVNPVLEQWLNSYCFALQRWG